MRQMIVSRYSFGYVSYISSNEVAKNISVRYYGVIIPCIMNLIGMIGFSILNSILGGQALASVSSHNLSWTWVISKFWRALFGNIASTIWIQCRNRRHLCDIPSRFLLWFYSFKLVRDRSLVRFIQPKVIHIHRYERLAWIPVLITCIIVLGVGGKHLSNPPPMEPATAAAVLSFASTLAGFSITYSGLSCDFTSYFRPTVSRYDESPTSQGSRWLTGKSSAGRCFSQRTSDSCSRLRV